MNSLKILVTNDDGVHAPRPAGRQVAQAGDGVFCFMAVIWL
jgi:broad specificity polyphosphatase/5'/3'-nucleotidase SurE